MLPAISAGTNKRMIAALLLLCILGMGMEARAAESVETYVERADSARVAGVFEIELAALRYARAEDSTDVHALWRLARAFVELGELASEKSQKRRFFQEALRHGQAAIAADSQSSIAFTWLAIAEGETAGVVDFKERIKLSWLIREHALKAIELDPEGDIAYHIMARWHAEIASIGGLKRAMANLLFGELPKASYEESVRYFMQAIAIHDQIRHRFELAKVYLRMDEDILAQQKLEDILSMDSEMRLDEELKEQARLLLAHLR